jgi:hypothetical protein
MGKEPSSGSGHGNRTRPSGKEPSSGSGWVGCNSRPGTVVECWDNGRPGWAGAMGKGRVSARPGRVG